MYTHLLDRATNGRESSAGRLRLPFESAKSSFSFLVIAGSVVGRWPWPSSAARWRAG